MSTFSLEMRFLLTAGLQHLRFLLCRGREDGGFCFAPSAFLTSFTLCFSSQIKRIASYAQQYPLNHRGQARLGGSIDF